nr:NLP/P60 protein precursor [Kibdelosporangium sp. MJ126-NF4]CTQ94224.1 NLP/P60 protein precursor [Kibdelosporangium sp. MJ126-NF4]
MVLPGENLDPPATPAPPVSSGPSSSDEGPDPATVVNAPVVLPGSAADSPDEPSEDTDKDTDEPQPAPFPLRPPLLTRLGHRRALVSLAVAAGLALATLPLVLGGNDKHSLGDALASNNGNGPSFGTVNVAEQDPVQMSLVPPPPPGTDQPAGPGTANPVVNQPATGGGGTPKGGAADSRGGGGGAPPPPPPPANNKPPAPAPPAPAPPPPPPAAARTTYSAVAGPGCGGFKKIGAYSDGNKGWYDVGSGGWGQDGCSSGFTAVPMFGDRNKDDPTASVLWSFGTGAVSSGSCAVSVFVPSGGKDSAGAPAFYTVEGGGSGSFSINQRDNQGAWVDRGPFRFSGNSIAIRLHTRGEDPNREHLGASAVRVTCS